MCCLISSVLSSYVRIEMALAHPQHPHASATVSAIHHISQSACSALGLGCSLAPIQYFPLCQTGAMMVSTEFPLGVNVVG
jgi:hypothetical protein